MIIPLSPDKIGFPVKLSESGDLAKSFIDIDPWDSKWEILK